MHQLNVITGKTDNHIVIDAYEELNILSGIPTFVKSMARGKGNPCTFTFVGKDNFLAYTSLVYKQPC